MFVLVIYVYVSFSPCQITAVNRLLLSVVVLVLQLTTMYILCMVL